MGVPEACLAGIARQATLDHSAATNPRPASEAEFLALLREAMG
jgi:4-hydroxybutyrate dehydrogenase